MITYPNMLMVGSAERNLGKTEFICRVITQLSGHEPITAVKVTVVEDDCGVVEPASRQHCESYKQLVGDVKVFHETHRDGRKDTHRMLRAGADNVFWILILRSNLHTITDVLDTTLQAHNINPAGAIIVEGNSTRDYIEPGMLVVIKKEGHEIEKSSCLNVLPLADTVIESYGNGWSIEPKQMKYNDSHWRLEESAAVIILAGGASKRMGTDKATLDIGGISMLRYIHGQMADSFAQVLVSSNNSVTLTCDQTQVVNDLEMGRGPLMGMVSCLEKSSYDVNFICACDCPQIDMTFVRSMIRSINHSDAVAPIFEGQPQPLFAVYRKKAVRAMKKQLSTGNNRVLNILSELNVRYIPLTGEWYRNINTPGQFEEFLEELAF